MRSIVELEVIKKSKATRLQLKGDVDLYSSPEVRKKIVTLINKKNKNLLVNFKDVHRNIRFHRSDF